MSRKKQKSYWRSQEGENENFPRVQTQPEFSESDFFSTLKELSSVDRRSFLKAVGFSFGTLALSACERAPTNKIISTLVQPEEIVPGQSYWFSSTCGGCKAGCGILVKNRDGRPLKIEGNPDHPLSGGGLCAVGQAFILGLYDDQRLRGPLKNGQETSWDTVDGEIPGRLEKIRQNNGRIRVLGRSLNSPTQKAAIDRFLKRFGNGRHVMYDPISCSALLDAHKKLYGARVLPRYRFERAELILSLDADFLGTWISPVEFARAYRNGRNPESARFARHIQLEGRMSLTGSNADQRIALDPADVPLVLAHLAQKLGHRAQSPVRFHALPACSLSEEKISRIAEELWRAQKKSLVVCGQNNLEAQLLTAYVNHLLKNAGETIDLQNPSGQYQGNDRELKTLAEELSEGKISALFVLDGNPLAELPDKNSWEKGLGKLELFVSFAAGLDETSGLAGYVCPDHHPLESWRDSEPYGGLLSLTQPVVQPAGKTRDQMESFSVWSGEKKTANEIIQDHWKQHFYPSQRGHASFPDFWNAAVQSGFAAVPARPSAVQGFNSAPLREVERRISSKQRPPGLTLVLYPKLSMLDGQHSQNPWLQELPDPVSKVAWDNYACVSPALAAQIGVRQGELLRLSLKEKDPVELPVYIQPGQQEKVVAVALGYGRQGTERFSRIGPEWIGMKKQQGRVGTNVSPLLEFDGNSIARTVPGLSLQKVPGQKELACTQTYHTLEIPAKLASHPNESREIVRETTYADFQKDPGSGNEPEEKTQSLWPNQHKYQERRWGMAVDLSACTGCSACVIGCQSENNVPVVGKDEVARRHDMAWIRIDRYYSGAGDGIEAVHQPMFCQQCGNAPCETVCPVLATMHSNEGINQQVYNRCVGTRYCENNCPYKVRRFNWFEYHKQKELSNLALNPDVTVRVKGVMEKCSFCIQRIQEAKFEAKRNGRQLRDGDIQPACVQSCPTRAIVFGNLNDPSSAVSKLRKSARHYRVLAELNVEPAVGYLVKVRNRENSDRKPEHG